MKVTLTLAALALGLSSIGVAQAAGHDAYYPALQTQQNAESRAQVVQDLQQAQAEGQLNEAGHDPYYPMMTHAASTLTHAQVMQSLRDHDGVASAAGHDPYYPTEPAV